MSSRTSVLRLAALLLAGCAVGPDYETPPLAVSEDWSARGAELPSAALPDSWWSVLDDAMLEQYLALAAKQNLDIRSASARVDAARAARGVARSAFWPQAGLDARYTRFEQSIESPGAAGSLIEAGLIDRDVRFYTTGLDASWELDLFGGNRRRAEVADARLDASVARRDAVRLAALAETATAYFELRGAQQRLDIVRSNVDAQQRTYDLTVRKVDAGLARRIDRLRARAQLDVLRAELPALRASIRASAWRLGVLTATEPSDIEREVSTVATLPTSPLSIPVGLRGDVLRRRPDVVAAERNLAAATASIGVAKAELFPKLTLSGNYGFEAESVAEIGTSDARTTAVVPFVRWPLFQGGRLRANLEAAGANAQASAYEYQKAVRSAVADAESAISDYAEELQSFERLSSAAQASRESAGIARRLYEQGLADFLTVLDADRRRGEAESARVDSHTRLLLKLVRLYKALGGGWQVETATSAD